MLYLIKSYGQLGKSFLKIGFSGESNIDRRLESYFYQNPGSQVLSCRPEDEMMEKMIHLYLYSLGLQYKKNGKLDEWFIDDPRVYQIFHISKEKLKTILWKIRERIQWSFRNNLIYTVYKELFEKNRDKIVLEEYLIKNGNPIKTKSKKIDREFFLLYIREKENISENYSRLEDNIVKDFLDNHFYMTGIFEEKMRIFCEFMDQYKDNKYVVDSIIHKVDPKFKTYYDLYGTSGCKASGYHEANIKKSVNDQLKGDDLRVCILREFTVSEKYTLKDIKFKINEIYKSLGINKTPKAKELENYFELKSVLIPVNGKRDKGYKIIGII